MNSKFLFKGTCIALILSIFNCVEGYSDDADSLKEDYSQTRYYTGYFNIIYAVSPTKHQIGSGLIIAERLSDHISFGVSPSISYDASTFNMVIFARYSFKKTYLALEASGLMFIKNQPVYQDEDWQGLVAFGTSIPLDNKSRFLLDASIRGRFYSRNMFARYENEIPKVPIFPNEILDHFVFRLGIIANIN